MATSTTTCTVLSVTKTPAPAGNTESVIAINDGPVRWGGVQTVTFFAMLGSHRVGQKVVVTVAIGEGPTS